MPYTNADGEPLASIELAQVPPDDYRFQLRSAIHYREPGGTVEYTAPAHTPSDHPQDGQRTDLASVPQFLWSFVASYGRQSAAAIVHDAQSDAADLLGDPAAALGQRRTDDRVFRVGLREQRVPLVRAWLMWSWVSVGRYVAFKPWVAVLMIAQAVVALAVVVLASVLAFSNLLWLLLLLVPAALALPWGRDAGLMLVLSYGGAFTAPLIALHLLSLLPFRLVEFVGELVSGGEPTKVFRPTVRG